MKRVKFFRMEFPLGGKAHYVEAGEVRLLDDGTLEFSDPGLRAILEEEPVMLPGGRYLWPKDGRDWFMALPLGFCGTAFRASEVLAGEG